MKGGLEDIEFLARSETRAQLVKALHAEGSLTRDELRDYVEASRTTVQRNLEALEDRGWVQEDNRLYSLDSCGELIAEDFSDLLTTVSVAEHLQPVIKWVDSSKLDFDFGLLTDANVVSAKQGDPWAMVNQHVSRLKEANEIRATLPLTGLHAMEATQNRVLHHNASVEYIVTPEVMNTFLNSQDYREIHDELIEADKYNLYLYDGNIPYYLGILDDIVQIGVDENGAPRALLETRNDAVLTWAENAINNYRREAELTSENLNRP